MHNLRITSTQKNKISEYASLKTIEIPCKHLSLRHQQQYIYNKNQNDNFKSSYKVFNYPNYQSFFHFRDMTSTYIDNTVKKGGVAGWKMMAGWLAAALLARVGGRSMFNT